MVAPSPNGLGGVHGPGAVVTQSTPTLTKRSTSFRAPVVQPIYVLRSKPAPATPKTLAPPPPSKTHIGTTAKGGGTPSPAKTLAGTSNKINVGGGQVATIPAKSKWGIWVLVAAIAVVFYLFLRRQ